MDALINTLNLISGGKPASYYLAGMFFASLAILLSWYLASKKRDPSSPATPENFSWWFLIWDNVKKGIVTLILMFIFLRLFELDDAWLTIGLGFFLAFGLDKAIELLMEYTSVLDRLRRDRSKYNQKHS